MTLKLLLLLTFFLWHILPKLILLLDIFGLLFDQLVEHGFSVRNVFVSTQ